MIKVVDLLNREYKGSYEFLPYNNERVLSQIRRRRLTVLVAVENGSVLGIIATHSEEDGEENITWLAVDESHNRREMEDMLVNHVEKNVQSNTVSTMIDEDSPKIKDWTARGYVLHPGFQRMSAELQCSTQVPQVGERIKFRTLRSDEEAKLIDVMNAGFGWQRMEVGDIERWKTDDPQFSEEWVHVAEVDERIVSAVVARPDTDYNKYLHFKRGHLGPAATLPEFRNKHLASALTARAMNFLYEKGMDSVRLGTSEQNVSSIALLRSLGFKVDVVRKILRKKLGGA